MPLDQLQMDDAIMEGFNRADMHTDANEQEFTATANKGKLTAAWFMLLQQVGPSLGLPQGIPPEQIEKLLMAQNKAAYLAAKNKFIAGGTNGTKE